MARALSRALRAEARPPKGMDLRADLGSPLPVLGVAAAGFGRIVREFGRDHPGMPIEELRAVADELWKGPTFDERILAVALLDRAASRLDDACWRMMDRWVNEASGWALSDGLASGPVAEVVAREPRRLREVGRWVRSGDRWRRRAALYAMNRLVREGRLSPALKTIHWLRRDPERWVQRAVGTWLRECWKKDEPRIRRYLETHVRDLSPIAITVATERAPASFRAALRARRVSRR